MLGWFRRKAKETTALKSISAFFSTHIERRRSKDEPFVLELKKAQVTYAGDDTGMDASYALQDDIKPISTYTDDVIPEGQLRWYASQGFIGYQVSALLMQHWFIDKACTMPAKDAVRNGYEITVNDGTQVDPKILDYIRKADKRYKLKKHLVEFIRYGKCFGIRVAMFVVNSSDPDYYKKPFNIDGIEPGSYKGISQIDPYWMVPELTSQNVQDPASQRFYEPTFWRVNGRVIHYTHLCIFTTGAVPDVMKPSYYYGGVSIPQKVFERVYAAERTSNEAPMLAMTKRLTTFKTELEKGEFNSAAFAHKMQLWTEIQNNFGIKIHGGDEDVKQFDTTLSDMDNLIMTQWQLACSIVNVPGTKMLGTQPKGFNSTGDYEETSYHEELESLQENDMSPLIEKHHQLLIKSEVCPKFGVKPFETTTVWKPLDAMTAVEQAQLNLIKAQTDEVYVALGAIDGADVKARIIADPESGYNGVALAQASQEPAQPLLLGHNGGPPLDDAQQGAHAAAGMPAADPLANDPVAKPPRPQTPHFAATPGA